MRGWRALAAGLAVASAPVQGLAAEPVVQEVLDILKERGIVDDGEYTRLSAENQAYEEEQAGLLGGIEWSGDLRMRLENYWYDRDTTGQNQDNRTRMRYRLRLQGKADVNDYVSAVFRIASGEAVNFDEGPARSTNRTLGRDNDFGIDPLFIDRAYLEFRAPGDWLPGASGALQLGKIPNPFRWKIGKDFLMWDGDINPEGVGVTTSYAVSEATSLFLNAGYFLLDENGTDADPHVTGVQGGVHVTPGEDWTLGARATWYSLRSLNPAFFGRGARFGNIEDALTDDAPTIGAENFQVGELAAYLRFTGFGDWPVLVFAHYAKNFDEVPSQVAPASQDEDTGWGIGVEVGDKRKNAALGLGYYRLEANYWPGQFMDSDITDSITNRAGWHVYGTREILPNTDLAVELLWSDELRSTLPDFETSARDAERIRLRTDITVKF